MHNVIRGPIRGLHQDQQPCGAAQTGRTNGFTRAVLIAAQSSCTRWLSTHGSTTMSSHSYAGEGAVHHITSQYVGIEESTHIVTPPACLRNRAPAIAATTSSRRSTGNAMLEHFPISMHHSRRA